MNLDLLLFGIAPYVAIALAVSVTLYRYRTRRFSFSSLSSQLLERRALFWGSIPFHWGILPILTGHLVAFLLPQAILGWNAAPLRLYALEVTGLALGLWALAGLLVLLWRRLSYPRLQAISTGMDLAVLAALLVSVATGVFTALTYRWGSNWFAAVATPYLWSIATFAPKPELVADLPPVVKAHVFNFFVLLAIFPFSRLVHVVTLPVRYLWRPWQIVVWNRRPGLALRAPAVRRGARPATAAARRPAPEAVIALPRIPEPKEGKLG